MEHFPKTIDRGEVDIPKNGPVACHICYIRLGEVGTGEVGIAVVGTAEVGTDELGTAEVGTDELGTAEVGKAEVGKTEVGTAEDGRAEVGCRTILEVRRQLSLGRSW